MLVSVQLCLPRDARYVPTMRNLAACLLRDVHAPEDAADDVEIAVSEACANVVRHALGTDDYELQIDIGAGGCTIEVVDRGLGLADAVSAAPEDAESGRGLLLMRALMDEMQFVREDERTRVRLVKRWDAAAGELEVATPLPV